MKFIETELRENKNETYYLELPRTHRLAYPWDSRSKNYGKGY